jgi:hypothetical protein
MTVKNTRITQERMHHAIDALIFAMHSAERELPASFVKRIDAVIGRTEAIRDAIKERASKVE